MRISTARLLRPAAFLAALVGLAGAAAADTVVLANGRSFEGVEARVDGERVRIRFDYGEMAVPLATVARIERGSTALARFEERWRALASGEAAAADWLDLARWAHAQGLDHGAARAAQRAAALDPDLEGVGALLAGLGFVREETTGAWMPVDELMARRGWVRQGTGWVAPEEAAAQRAAVAREEANRRAAVREERVLRTMEMLALAELAERTEPEPPAVGLPLYPVLAVPGFPGHGRRHDGDFDHHRRDDRRTLDDLLHRNPGSLLPVGTHAPRRSPGSLITVEPGRRNHGGYADPRDDG